MKKNIRKLNKKGKFIIYFFILLIILFIYILISSDIFKLKEIELKGNTKITKSDIIDYSKIKMGENIFKYNLKDLEDKLYLNPYIKKVIIKRKIPDKLVIKIEENREYAVITTGKRYIYIGKGGIVLSENNKLTNKNIPMITGVYLKEKNINKKIKFDLPNSNELISMIDNINKNNMEREIEVIKINKDYIYLNTKDNLKVIISKDLNYNINRLKVILLDLKNKHKKGGDLDLRTKGKAIYSP